MGKRRRAWEEVQDMRRQHREIRPHIEPLASQAARIVELEAENARLRSELDGLRGWPKFVPPSGRPSPPDPRLWSSVPDLEEVAKHSLGGSVYDDAAASARCRAADHARNGVATGGLVMDDELDCWRDRPIAGTFTLTFNGRPPLSDHPATRPSVDQAFGSGQPWIDSHGWLGDKGQGWRVLSRDISLKPSASTVIYKLRKMERVDGECQS